MSKRSIILTVLAVILFIAAIFSLFFEKKKTEDELNQVLGNKPTVEKEDTDGSGTEQDNSGQDEQTG